MSLFSSYGSVSFDVVVIIESLNDITLINSLFYAKWNLGRNSESTPKLPVSNHSVFFNTKISDTLKIPYDKHKKLNNCFLNISVRMVTSNGKKSKIGNLYINLSEYAKSSTTTRRYILQNCKVNATMKISIMFKQVSGIIDFTAPQLDRSILLTEIGELVFKDDGQQPKDTNSDRSYSSKGLSNTDKASSGSNLAKNSRGLFMPIDDSFLNALSPYKSSLQKNDKIVDDILKSVFSN